MIDPGAMVRTTDLRDGSFEEIRLDPGNYVIVCAPGRYISHEQVYANGTVIVTLKRDDDSAAASQQ